IDLRAIEKRGYPEVALDVACGDDAVSNGDRHPVDNFRCQQTRRSEREQDADWSGSGQNVCPIEKKNRKWPRFCLWHLLGSVVQGSGPSLIKSSIEVFGSRPMKDGGLMA